MKKAFTLIELTITVVIMAMLIGVVFETFIMISNIAVKVQNERALHNELIYVIQTIQNIVDAGDTELYGYVLSGDLSVTTGIKPVLNLSGTANALTIEKSSSGNYLEMTVNDRLLPPITYRITDPSKVTLNEFYVKILPYDDQAIYINKMHDGFRMFLDVQTPYYDPLKWWRNIRWQMQTFFNLRVYD